MIQDVLKDFVLTNGVDKMVGRIDEFQPPNLKVKAEDFRGAGMDGVMDIDMGMEKLECSWVSSGIDRGTYSGFGIIIGVPTIVTVRAAVVDPVTGIPKPVYHTCGGQVRSIDPAAYKPGDRATLKATMTLTYYRLTHTLPGVPVHEIDVINGIRIVNGVDQLLALRLIVAR